jgi:hypothetical protein
MNTRPLLIAALATAFAGTSFATSKSPADLQQEAQLRAPSTVTRAQVISELNAARANGTLNVHPDYGTRAVAGPSQLTRTAVLAELNAARADGTLNVHPDYGTRAVTGSSQLTRAQARAEVAAAMARGERLSQGDSNRNSPSVHRPLDERGPATAASRDAAAVK